MDQVPSGPAQRQAVNIGSLKKGHDAHLLYCTEGRCQDLFSISVALSRACTVALGEAVDSPRFRLKTFRLFALWAQW